MKKTTIYQEELAVLDQFKSTLLNQNLSTLEIREHSTRLLKQYEKILNQSEKLSRISDNIQKKLLRANDKIQKQKEALKSANEEIEKSRQTLLDELSHAASYVHSLLPPAVTSGQIQTDWLYMPSDQLGGDSFGYHWIDSDHFAMYLLDVCGHGVKSALLSVSAFNTLRSQTLPSTNFRNPAEVIQNLNIAYQMESHFNLYFTIWYGVFQVSSGKLHYVAAGHPPALMLQNQSGNITELGVPNPAVGWMPEMMYESASTKIPEAQVSIYLLSDGVYEVEDEKGEIWSLKELSQYLIMHQPANTAEMEELYRYLQERGQSKKLADDFSLLRIQFDITRGTKDDQ